MKKYLMSLIIVVIIAAVAIGVLLGKIEKLEMENAALAEELAVTQTLLETTLAERDAYAEQLAALETQHAILQADYDAVIVQKETLANELATVNASYTAAQLTIADLEGYKTKAAELEAELASATTNAMALSVENADLIVQIDAARLSVENLEQEVTQLKGRIAILRELMK